MQLWYNCFFDCIICSNDLSIVCLLVGLYPLCCYLPLVICNIVYLIVAIIKLLKILLVVSVLNLFSWIVLYNTILSSRKRVHMDEEVLADLLLL